MSLSVDRIPGSLSIDPDAAGEENRHQRGRQSRKRDGGDSVSISEEARRLLTEGDQGTPEGAEPG
jgi:hypothetical protein